MMWFKKQKEMQKKIDMGILCTSAHPLHAAHLDMVHWFEERCVCEVLFEISGINADKGLISREEADKRLKQVTNLGRSGWIDYKCPTFISKAVRLYQEGMTEKYNIYFLVGADTFNRIIDDKYYFGSHKEMLRCLNIMFNLGTKLIVFPRVGYEVVIPQDIIDVYSDYITVVSDYKPLDISSTQLRAEHQVY